MSYPIQSLIENLSAPLCITPADPAPRALELMIEHDYSQLPVIDRSSRPLGLITHASILNALSSFGLSLEQIHVEDALVTARTLRPEDDLFDLLDHLRQTNAVLVVNAENKLTHIITSYDAFEFFRRRSEDLLLVEDIESTMKDLIQGAFTDATNTLDQTRLNRLIEEVTPSPLSYRKKFERALAEVLKALNQGPVQITDQSIERGIKVLNPPKAVKSFDRLTFNEYLDLLLHDTCWNTYAAVFRMEKTPFRRLLEGVRDTRNALAHFRGAITAAQRQQLRYAAEWLNRRQLQIQPQPQPIHLSSHDNFQFIESRLLNSSSENLPPAPIAAPLIPADEATLPGDSRYAALADWLRSQPAPKDRLTLTFEEIETIIGGPLPDSARRHRVFWANDTVGHNQSQQWLDAGWRTTSVSMTDERLTFVRIAEREGAYIKFFSALLDQLAKEKDFPPIKASPDGASWINIRSLPISSPQLAMLACAFTRLRRFRVEVYIDTGSQLRNKAIFDALHDHRIEIEKAIGQPLHWERIDDKRASRIAAYHPGYINDPEPKLSTLLDWAVQSLRNFYPVMADRPEYLIQPNE